uniref:CARDB domain-containing protein n=1 Tax=candidate division WOR-3 bacterium TaxID=2052148 RepID=A0A7C3UQA0_UNCW3
MRRVIFLFIFSLPVWAKDIGVNKIFAPTGIIAPGFITPRVQIKNFASEEESLFVYFSIFLTNGEKVYYESSFAKVNGNATQNVSFSPWNATLGSYIPRCSTALLDDVNPVNDTLSEKVLVLAITPGQWISRESMPPGPDKKRVKDGGAMVDGSKGRDKFIYALKGNNTREFYCYDAILNQWFLRREVPIDPLNPKNVKKGGSLTKEGDYIYLIKGNKTFEFWAYDINGDSWIRRKDVPSGPEGKALKGGSFITRGKIENKNYIFLIKGGTKEFYAYDIGEDTWISRREIPYTERPTKIKDGSCLVYDGGGHLYLLKGGYNELFFYDCNSDTWSPKKPMPLFGSTMRKRKVKNGAAMVYERGQDVIYALKGGGTNEFWAYFVEGDSWHELASVPLGEKGKKVKGGGSLSLTAGQVFALKGGGSNELWMYTPPAFLIFSGINSSGIPQRKNSIKVASFGKFKADEKVFFYDALGRFMPQKKGQKGIYFLKRGDNFIKVVVIK